MEEFSGFTIDPDNGRIYFEGGCEKAREICEAMCCRRVHYVDISEEEAKSGLYEVDTLRGFNSGSSCDRGKPDMNVTYILSKKPDGSCVYLDPSNMCSIYDKRPAVCREFECSSGWGISDMTLVEIKDKNLSDTLKEGLKKDIEPV